MVNILKSNQGRKRCAVLPMMQRTAKKEKEKERLDKAEMVKLHFPAENTCNTPGLCVSNREGGPKHRVSVTVVMATFAVLHVFGMSACRLMG